MTIDTLFAIKTSAIDYDLIERAGPPGTPGRTAVATALTILSQHPSYRHGSRGPHAFDWLGLVRATVEQTLVNCFNDAGAIADALGYGPLFGPQQGLAVSAFRMLALEWGLQEIPFEHAKPGDVLLFGMPSAYAAMLLCDEPGFRHARTAWAPPPNTVGVIAGVECARPPAQSWLTAEQMGKIVCAYTWPKR